VLGIWTATKRSKALTNFKMRSLKIYKRHYAYNKMKIDKSWIAWHSVFYSNFYCLLHCFLLRGCISRNANTWRQPNDIAVDSVCHVSILSNYRCFCRCASIVMRCKKRFTVVIEVFQWSKRITCVDGHFQGFRSSFWIVGKIG